MNKILLRALTVSLISLLISTTLWLTGILTPFENRVWDERVKIFANKEMAPENIVVVFLDQASLDWAESEQGLSWPWPREVLTTIINFVKRGGAKSINFDVLYTEASNYGVWDDMSFGDSIRESGIFIGSTTLTHSSTGVDGSEIEGLEVEGIEEWLQSSSIENYPYITSTIPEVWENSKYLVNVRQAADSDGVYRRVPLFYMLNNKVIPSHALASFLTTEVDTPLVINNNYFSVGGYKIPINERGETILKYRGPSGTYRNYPAANIINSELAVLTGVTPDIDPALFKDSHVYFGYKASGLHDLRATPISGKDTGVEIHMTMLDNLITEDFIRESRFSMDILVTLIIIITAAVLFTRFQKITASLLIATVSLSIPILLSGLFYRSNIWFPLIYTELTVILTLAGTGIMNFTTEGKQKRFIKSAFKQYLSPDVIENILAKPDQLKLGGEKKEISIFFSDLQGFTSISENLTPEGLTKLINEYLTAMTDIIQEEGGTIDKYEGDAIIAFWNAPLTYKDHASRSVRAALRCQEKLKEMRPYFREMTGYDLYMRIGINTGDAVVGNMGSQSRFDYTMLGDSVNLAARLEGINKVFGTYTLISEFSNKRVPEIHSREIGRVRVVGKTQPITLYEPLLTEQDETRFPKALKLFYKGEFREAYKLFRQIECDPAAEKYCTHIEQLLKHPKEPWDGVMDMTSK